MEEALESDEEVTKTELENAIKTYKKNKCKHSETKYDAANESTKINKSQSFYAKNINDNDNDSRDMLKLINYFRKEKISQNQKSVTKIYSDYERQGAIPKSKTKNDSSKLNWPKTSEMNSEKKIRNQKCRKKQEIYFGKNQASNDSFCVGQPEISKTEYSLYSFVNSNYDDVIVKINNETCSSPFFYVVPNNPSPNFFFSPGSYYIIPKTPNSLQEEIIIFHPERTLSAAYERGGDLLKPEKKVSRVIKKCTGSSYESSVPCMNNLGKEVSRKEDSHLNIGPLDAKLNEFFSNLENSYVPNKICEKALLNPTNSNALNVNQKRKSKTKLKDRAKETDFQIHEDNSTKNTYEIKVLNALFLERNKKNLDENNGESNTKDGREMQQTDQKLTLELLDSDKFSMDDKYLSDRRELLTLETDCQLKKMILSLPEINIEELQKKLFEFQGDENLVESYIQETKLVLANRQRLLDMQFIFPDADPNFLYQEIEKLMNDDDTDCAINVLIEDLLDSKAYPKIPEDNLNSEKNILWQKYVQNFSVKNFILKVSNPQDFSGPNGNHNKANIDVILKFLTSRYPLSSQDFLEKLFRSNNNNLTKTCEVLKSFEAVRLSESSFQHEAFDEALLKEICYIDHREEIDNYLREIEERKNLEREEARLNNTFLSCPLCIEVELVASEVIPCPEGHVFCKECIKRYVFVKLSDGIYKFLCPLDKCDAFFLHATLEQLLPESVLLTIIKKQQAEEINNAKLDGLESCPFCEFAYIPNPEDKIFKCRNPECLNETCRVCHEKNHIPLRCEEIERSIDVEARKKIEETMTEELLRSCPTCLRKFVKIDGCNKIKCSCGTTVCYFCRKKIQDYSHFREESSQGTCPLYSSNQMLHTTNVVEAGIQARNYILRNSPNVRILHDPTI